MRALDLGFTRLKFFPAEAAGGLPALKALSAVFGEVRFCPTGGITQDNARRLARAASRSPASAAAGSCRAGEPSTATRSRPRARAAAALRQRLKSAARRTARLLMTPVSVSTKRKARESALTLVEDRSRIAGRFLAARRAAAGLDDYPGDLPGDARRGLCDPGRGDRALGPAGDRLEGRPGPAAADRALRHRPARRPDLRAAAGARRTARPVEMPVFAEGFAAGEAEFLLRIGAAPPRRQDAISRLDEAADLIDAVHVGIEIASSPLGRDQRARPDRGHLRFRQQ